MILYKLLYCIRDKFYIREDVSQLINTQTGIRQRTSVQYRCVNLHVRHAYKHAVRLPEPDKCTDTRWESPEADWCILFLKQQWEISEASLVRYVDSPSVCVCEHCEFLHFIKHIPRSGLSLSSSKWNNSLFSDLVCLGFLQVWVFQVSALTVKTMIWLRKLIIDFIRQQTCGPL